MYCIVLSEDHLHVKDVGATDLKKKAYDMIFWGGLRFF